MLIFLLMYLILIISCNSKPNIRISDKGILPLHKNSVGIQLYVAIKNQGIFPCLVSTWSKRCCLNNVNDNKDEKCNVFDIVGGDTVKMGHGEHRKFLFVYPTIYPFNKQGHCLIVLQHECDNILKRNNLKIDFDTNVFKRSRKRNKLFKEFKSVKKRSCSYVDQDPFDNCAPVNCKWKYDGVKPFYDKAEDKCVEAPLCIDETSTELPNVVYIALANKCKMLSNPLSVEETRIIKNGYTNKPKVDYRKKKDMLNGMTISQNIEFLKDMLYMDLADNYKENTKSAIVAIIVSVFVVFGILFVFLCTLSLVSHFYKQWLKGQQSSSHKRHRVNKEEVNMLLRDVLIRDIPLELRNSTVDVYGRSNRGRERLSGEELLNISLEEFESDMEEQYTSSDN